MKNIASITLLTLISLCLFQGSASANEINTYFKTEIAKIDFEFNCTVDGNVSTYFDKNEEAAKIQAIVHGLQTSDAGYQELEKSTACVKPQYRYSCFLPKNSRIPLSGTLTYTYYSNEPTLASFLNSEAGKKLHNCQAPLW